MENTTVKVEDNDATRNFRFQLFTYFAVYMVSIIALGFRNEILAGRKKEVIDNGLILSLLPSIICGCLVYFGIYAFGGRSYLRETYQKITKDSDFNVDYKIYEGTYVVENEEENELLEKPNLDFTTNDFNGKIIYNPQNKTFIIRVYNIEDLKENIDINMFIANGVVTQSKKEDTKTIKIIDEEHLLKIKLTSDKFMLFRINNDQNIHTIDSFYTDIDVILEKNKRIILNPNNNNLYKIKYNDYPDIIRVTSQYKSSGECSVDNNMIRIQFFCFLFLLLIIYFKNDILRLIGDKNSDGITTWTNMIMFISKETILTIILLVLSYLSILSCLSFITTIFSSDESCEIENQDQKYNQENQDQKYNQENQDQKYNKINKDKINKLDSIQH